MKILILCTGNSCRSQMAHGLLVSKFPSYNIFRAGTKPEKVNLYAVKVMKLLDIDISRHKSNHVDEYSKIDFDYVFTVCDNAKQICPVFPKSVRLVHKSFIDPADAKGNEDEKLLVYKNVRNELQDYFNKFFDKLN